MQATADHASARSTQVRKYLERIPRMNHPLTRAQARPVLDGTTDLAVVNSGFSLAAGLPGSLAYQAVQVSNLSKAGPDGKIAKDPSGKWIKGPNYRMPELDSLLPG